MALWLVFLCLGVNISICLVLIGLYGYRQSRTGFSVAGDKFYPKNWKFVVFVFIIIGK